MGTLITRNSIDTDSKQKPISDEIDKQRKKLSKKLDKEYKKIRNQCEDLRQAYIYFDDAQTNDDIYYRLLLLEKQVQKMRKGGFLSGGAKTHRRLLKKLQKIGLE